MTVYLLVSWKYYRDVFAHHHTSEVHVECQMDKQKFQDPSVSPSQRTLARIPLIPAGSLTSLASSLFSSWCLLIFSVTKRFPYGSGFSPARTLSKFFFLVLFLSSSAAYIKLQGEELQLTWAVITDVKDSFCQSQGGVLCLPRLSWMAERFSGMESARWRSHMSFIFREEPKPLETWAFCLWWLVSSLMWGPRLCVSMVGVAGGR